MTYLALQKLRRSLFTKNFTKLLNPPSVDCSPFPWTFMGNPGDGEKSYQTTKNLLISPIKKIPLYRFKSFAIKSFIFPIKKQLSSNHPMQCSFVAAVISVVSYFKFQDLCTAFSMTKALNGWSSPKQNFHSLHLFISSLPPMLFQKPCF